MFVNQNNMEVIKGTCSELFRKLKLCKRDATDISLYWRIIVTAYLILFVAIIALGWMIFSWSISSNATAPRMKTIKAEVTMEEVNKVNEITESKKNKLEEVIKQDVRAIEMK